jgi:riboflavin kinase/FMN adenylyltransferase
VRITQLPDAEPRPRRVAVGTFDGVHRGHREVIEGADTVLTFEPHPVSVISPGNEPKLLTTLQRKAELVASLGVRELVVIPFDRDFASRSAQEFIDDVLVGRLGATHVSVGENFHFGNRAQGDAGLLGADPRFETRVAPLLEVDGEIVSSSHIRGLVAGGALEYAGTLLGTPFVRDGTVSHGDERGRTLGYPTANLVPQEGYATPGHGVYACRAQTEDGRWHAAAVNVGVRPMFESGLGELIEAYLLDFEQDLYDQLLRIEFLKRLRGEKRFVSIDALLEQMALDVEATRMVAGPAG